ncbi:MAG TPA: hypothetical protein RMH99_02675 [Sandaracinaceae bacterium LLY-WYZ-13_1]|nr:hypothetical protein [Sandaracinaceae bacterium LLY-WYZ-13_1]
MSAPDAASSARDAHRVAESEPPPGVDWLAPEQAAQLFEDAHSREVVELGPAEREELSRCRREMGAALGAEDHETARRLQAECGAVLRQAARSDLSAQTRELYMQACYVMVQQLLNGGLERAAVAQARTCRLQAMDVEPTRREATDEVLDVFALARSELDGQPRATLVVRTPPGRGCRVRVRDQDAGEGPEVVLETLVPGPARVRVDCAGTQGRIHFVDLEPGERSELSVDPDFEAAVSTGEALELVYRDPARWAGHAEDAGRVARALSVDAVLLVGVEPSTEQRPARLRLELCDPQGRRRASAQATGTDSDLARALSALAAGESGEGPSEAAGDPLPHVLGASALGATGAALAIAGLVLSTQPSCVEPENPSGPCALRRPDWALVGGLGVPGVALALAGTGWALAALSEGPAAWHVAGAVSAAGALAAVLDAVLGKATEGCASRSPSGACETARRFAPESGAILGVAAGLSAVAAGAFFVLGATQEPGEVRLGVGPGSLMLGGTF